VVITGRSRKPFGGLKTAPRVRIPPSPPEKFMTKNPATSNFALIFDMDGVVVDNTKYHILAWQKFAKKLGVNVSANTVKHKFMGRLGREILKMIIGKEITSAEMLKLDLKREAYYRQIYSKAIKPVTGLPEFLQLLKNNSIKVALATAAPPANVKFTLGRTGLRKYFKVIIDATGVKRGKPSPDVFLKAARVLKVKPSNCIVFEDAMMGIEAAKRAGMKVVGVATTHRLHELKHTDLAIKNFSKVNLKQLSDLLTK
jgi:beta-phosphoglucomutase